MKVMLTIFLILTFGLVACDPGANQGYADYEYEEEFEDDEDELLDFDSRKRSTSKYRNQSNSGSSYKSTPSRSSGRRR